MSDDNPNKNDVMAVMKRLRGISSNKTCFDCGAKNPTWASVTYGIFLCIDCSAVHRSLGVHLSFVRSTQLDTKWDWLQLRAMQVGGNAHASEFFRSHGCDTTDAQQKYNSKAASLYTERLKQLAVQSMKVHGTKLHLEITSGDGSADEKERGNKSKKGGVDDDFFKTHSDTTLTGGWQDDAAETLSASQKSRNGKVKAEPEEGPSGNMNLDLASAGSDSTMVAGASFKNSMGARKAIPKKGGKLGAQKVESNFEDFEKQAEAAEKRKLEALANRTQFEVTASSEDARDKLSTRLTYQDSEGDRKKEEDRLKKSDPKKAEQLERLGMGVGARGKISHSITSDMTKIEQERPGNRNDFRSYGAVDRQPVDSNDWNRSDDDIRSSRYNSRSENEPAKASFDDYMGRLNVKDSSFDEDYKKPSSTSDNSSRYSKKADTSASSGDDAQKKFGNAKSISSDMYFGNKESDYEVKSSLSRFDGKSSISSADYFGTGSPNQQSSYQSSSSASALSNLQAPDLTELKESVKQGVTKVAGRLSSMASSVMNNIQERYG